MVGENFDAVNGDANDREFSGREPVERLFLGVHFTCCRVYTRVYVNRDGAQYIGHCPRCARRVKFQVGPGGTDERFFTAY